MKNCTTCACNDRRAQRDICAADIADKDITAKVMVFITPQQWGGIYPEPQALSRGTLFAPLDKPFCGKGGCCCG